MTKSVGMKAVADSPRSQTLRQYVVGGLDLSMKGCVEGQGSIVSLLQKACSSPGLATEEQQFCLALPSIAQRLDGVDLAASLCVQKSVPLAQAGEAICAGVAPSQQASCLAVFSSAMSALS